MTTGRKEKKKIKLKMSHDQENESRLLHSIPQTDCHWRAIDFIHIHFPFQINSSDLSLCRWQFKNGSCCFPRTFESIESLAFANRNDLIFSLDDEIFCDSCSVWWRRFSLRLTFWFVHANLFGHENGKYSIKSEQKKKN